MSLVVFLGMLPLHDLVKFGGDHLAQFVSDVFDLGEGSLEWRTIFPERFASHHASEFLHLLEHFGGISVATFLNDFRES